MEGQSAFCLVFVLGDYMQQDIIYLYLLVEQNKIDQFESTRVVSVGGAVQNRTIFTCLYKVDICGWGSTEQYNIDLFISRYLYECVCVCGGGFTEQYNIDLILRYIIEHIT